MKIEIRDQRLLELIDPEVELEQLASGFIFTEGPVWQGEEGCLIFSDIPANKMYRLSADEDISIFRDPSHNANGNTLDRQNRILTCEHATSRVTRQNVDGSIEVLASHFGDKELNSPNDIIVRADGSIYFTDPPYGRVERVGVPRSQQLDFQGVYRLDPVSNDLSLLIDDFDKPNGLCFSVDERRLFVDDTARGHIRVFDIEPEGTLSPGRVWAELEGEGIGGADGMKIDSEGNLYCTGPGGIHIFDPTANYLGVLRMPEQAANLCFGDADKRSLYITASTSIYRLRTRIPG
ncbi:MAG: SMP-30/gluconolactonase/LRE family protein [Chloroflexi bacterium]|nr:SMP-30/gluconolactonase/LRE family protein [Chloroflexota bacterium]